MLQIAFGTRPELIKIQPLLKLLPEDKYSLLCVGQHTDLFPVEMPKSRHVRNIVINEKNGNNRLNNIVRSILEFPVVYDIFDDTDHVMIQGDTTTAFAVALAAFHAQISIIHLEAGLRTYQNEPYPEEFNRRAISLMTTIHLCPTFEDYENLIGENLNKNKSSVYVVGNTAMDNLVDYDDSDTTNNVVFITMHRRENHKFMDQWFTEINNLAKQNPRLKFVIPLHPNPNVTKCRHLLTNADVLLPLSHAECIEYIRHARMIITDSGGIQEEASWFHKPCIVCRQFTERKASLGAGGARLCRTPVDLKLRFNQARSQTNISTKKFYGRGHSAEAIIRILEDHNVI